MNDLKDTKSTNNPSFGNRVYSSRKKMGLTQIALAKKIGSSKGTIQNYEANTLPKGEYAIRLAKIFNCSIDWLLTGESPIYNGTTPEPDHQNQLSEKNNFHDTPADQPAITELITKTIEILESETVYSNALSANIQAFHYATGAEQRFRELQDSTNKRFKKMEGRIAALETENNKLQEQIKNIPPGGYTMVANQG